ncbi:MAG: hypothetical protein ACI8PG_003279 [Planctomycetota bacterium]|jgi:hypothetical protein
MARRKRKKKPAKAKPTGPSYTRFIVIIGLVFAVLFAVLLTTSDERSWQEYIEAGDRAYERGNYAWAEKMYREALQYAEQHGKDDPLVAKTWRHLNRLERTRSQAAP